MILRRYVIATVARPFLGMLLFFLALHFGWWTSKLIAAGGAASMTATEFFLIIGLQSLTALEVLLPVSLFLAIVTGLGRLASTQEATAMRALGHAEGFLLGSVVLIALTAAIVIGAESLNFRSQAFTAIYGITDALDQDMDFQRIEGGEFYVNVDDESGTEVVDESDARVIFADSSDGDELINVFVARNYDDSVEFIYARSARQSFDASGAQVLDFSQGDFYHLTENTGSGEDWYLDFDNLHLTINSQPQSRQDGRRKAIPTQVLKNSTVPYEIAEYQGRFAAPLSVLLLALLAVPLSRFAPRSGRYARIIFAAIFMIIYFNLYSLARTLMESGNMPLFPGVFWPHLLLLSILIGLLWPRRKPRSRRTYRPGFFRSTG